MSDFLEQNKPENTAEPKSSSVSLLNILLVVTILGLGVFGYLSGNFDGVSKKDLEENYIKKGSASFDNISFSQKQNYIPKDQYLDEIEKLKHKDPKVIEKIVEVEKIVYRDKIIEAKPKIIEKIVYKDKIITTDPKVIEKVIYKDKIVKTAPQIIENTIYKDRSIDKSKFDVFRCYGMSPSGYRLSNKCISGLKSFLEKNNEAKYFEVIAVMNQKDFRTLMILEEKADLLNQIDLNKKQVAQFKELSTVGLDKLRVVETLWEVKKILGKDTIVVPVSYNVDSKNFRGTVIRAYK